jgi:hypothetical protein
MTVRFLKQMTALAFMAGVAVLGSAEPANASPSVTYSTSGTFSGGNINGTPGATVEFGNYSVGNNGARLEFTPAGGNVLIPTYGSLGSITLSTTGSGAQITDVLFTLTLKQTYPSINSGDFTNSSQTLTGKVSFNQSGAAVVFDNPHFQTFNFTNPWGTGFVTYEITNPIVSIVPPNTLGGVATIQAHITGVIPTPEPGTVALALTGLPLLGFAAWRRRHTQVV